MQADWPIYHRPHRLDLIPKQKPYPFCIFWFAFICRFIQGEQTKTTVSPLLMTETRMGFFTVLSCVQAYTIAAPAIERIAAAAITISFLRIRFLR